MRIFFLAAFLVLAPAAHAQTTCAMGPSEHAWVNEQIDTWRGVSRDALRLNPDPLPLIIVFDQACVWNIDREIRGTPHGGSIALPDGEQVPARLMTFAGSYGPSEKPFVVMAMPSIWRADPKHAGNAGLSSLIRAVFTHEMAHTVQTAGIGQWMTDIENRLGLPGDLDDDIVQTPPSSLDFDRSASAVRSGRREMKEKYAEHNETSPALTAGDVDADWEGAYSSGDEAPGGDNPTPDQDLVDDIGRAVGVEYQDNEELKAVDKVIERDRNRWELDPASSDDWDER